MLPDLIYNVVPIYARNTLVARRICLLMQANKSTRRMCETVYNNNIITSTDVAKFKELQAIQKNTYGNMPSLTMLVNGTEYFVYLKTKLPPLQYFVNFNIKEFKYINDKLLIIILASCSGDYILHIKHKYNTKYIYTKSTIVLCATNSVSCTTYFKNDKLHRDQWRGPARIFTSTYNKYKCIIYARDGQLHRDLENNIDVPAYTEIIEDAITEYYFINGAPRSISAGNPNCISYVNGHIKYVAYLANNDLPDCDSIQLNFSIKLYCCFYDVKLHRDNVDLPVLIEYADNGNIVSEYCCTPITNTQTILTRKLHLIYKQNTQHINLIYIT